MKNSFMVYTPLKYASLSPKYKLLCICLSGHCLEKFYLVCAHSERASTRSECAQTKYYPSRRIRGDIW